MCTDIARLPARVDSLRLHRRRTRAERDARGRVSPRYLPCLSRTRRRPRRRSPFTSRSASARRNGGPVSLRTLPAARVSPLEPVPLFTGALAALAALGWIGQTSLPSSFAWLNPFDLKTAFSLFFDTIFALRDDAPAIYQLILSTSALVSIAFLMTASFTLVSRRILGREIGSLLIVGSATLICLGSPTAANAIEFLFERDAEIVTANEVVEQTWVSSARNVMIEGTLRGDLIALGDRVVISGVLDGNLVTGARKIEVSGEVTGSIIAFGERVKISGNVHRNDLRPL